MKSRRRPARPAITASVRKQSKSMIRRSRSSSLASCFVLGALGALAHLAGCTVTATTTTDTTPTTTAGTDGGTTTAPGDDAGVTTTPASDGGFSVAAHPTPPSVATGGGQVLASPKVVPIFYKGEPLEGDVTTFVNQLAASSFWSQATSEYGVGPLTVGASQHWSTSAPASTDDSAVENQLTAALVPGSWGAPDPNAIYMFVMPSTTTFSGSGTCCKDFDGYHAEATVGSSNVVYAIVCDCSDSFDGASISHTDALTSAITHELAEAATDPFVNDLPAGYAEADQPHGAWTVLGGGEVGDMCALYPVSDVTVSGIDHDIQRLWSNAAAKAGHDPCVPQPADEVFFQSDAVLSDTVVLTDSFGNKSSTKGVKIGVGSSKTVQVQLWSEGPTSGDWTVEALDGAYMMGGTANLSFAWDRTTGHNGDVLNLTITVNSANATWGGEIFAIQSTLGGHSTLSLGSVGQ
jgi:hypothetical protein